MINYNRNTIFEARGWSNETLQRYNVRCEEHNGRPALVYPTVGSGGAKGMRVKYIDGDKPKYTWLKHHDDCVYYSAGGLVKAIAEHDGVVYIVNGEAATWAFHSYQVALGRAAELAAPCVSWFGENSVPSTLADDLAAWNVRRAYLIVDCDEAGYKAALKVMRALEGKLPYTALKLPFDYGSGCDFNDLWTACALDANRVSEELLVMDILTAADIERCIGVKTAVDTPFRGATASNGTHTSDVDFKALYQEWVSSIITALGAPDKMEGKTPRWHCPLPTHDDKHPSFTVDYDEMRPRCTCGIHDRQDAWELVAQAKGLPTWDAYYHERLPKREYKVAQAQAAPAPVKRTMAKGTDVLNSLDSLMLGEDTRAIGNPVVFPLTALHELGGLCQYIPSGKLVGIVGGSGEGKTSLIETCVDIWNKGGIDVLVYTPEWTNTEYLQRRIQRYSGYANHPHITMDVFNEITLWLKEKELGIEAQRRQGREISKALLDEYLRVKKLLLNWQGETYLASDDSQQALYVDVLLEMVADTIADLRRDKRRADVFVMDYAQLAEVKEEQDSGKMLGEVMRQIKAHSIRHQYVGFIASQITKGSSKASKANGGMVTSDDAMYVRSDKFNLMLTINRIYEERNEERIATNYAYLYVDKNSLAKSKQKVKLPLDLPHLTWIDKAVKDENL